MRIAGQVESEVPGNRRRIPDSLAAPPAGATEFAANGDFEELVRVCARVVAVSPERASAYDDYADALLGAGRPGEAAEALRRAISLEGQSGFERRFSLGQLLGYSIEAVSELKIGIEMLRNERSKAAHERSRELTACEVSALCSLAETLLGIAEKSRDSVVVDGIDNEIESAIAQAVAICREGAPEEIEASMALANLRLSQGRAHEALVAMQRVVSAMSGGLEILEHDDMNTDNLVRGMEMLPPLDVRIAAGKQLLEVGLWADAVAVLNSVLYECDFNIEVWYMLAVGWHRISDPESAMNALQRARDLLSDPKGFVGQLDEGIITAQEEVIRGSAVATG